MSQAPLRLHRLRSVAGAVCLAFAAAVTVLPSLHLFGHRNDHVHVGDAIVYVGAGVEHDDQGQPHAHDHPHTHDDDYGQHPHQDPHHERAEAYGHDQEPAERPSETAEADPFIPDLQHGRGSLAHCRAAVLAAAVVVWDAPPSALAEIAIASPSCPDHLPSRPSPRLTRGPPSA